MKLAFILNLKVGLLSYQVGKSDHHIISFYLSLLIRSFKLAKAKLKNKNGKPVLNPTCGFFEYCLALILLLLLDITTQIQNLIFFVYIYIFV